MNETYTITDPGKSPSFKLKQEFFLDVLILILKLHLETPLSAKLCFPPN